MKKKVNFFERFSNWATTATGSSAAFIIASVTVIIWALTGPVFNYSETETVGVAQTLIVAAATR